MSLINILMQLANQGESTPSIDYYVSASGTALNDGLTENTPIDVDTLKTKSLQNKSIAFKKGDTFNDFTLNLDNASSVDSYGSGSAPHFKGSKVVTGFTNEGGGIYSKVIPEGVKWMYRDGVAFEVSKTTMQTFTGNPPAANEVNVDSVYFDQFADITGSEMSFIEFAWRIDYGKTVTAYTSGKITLNWPLPSYGTLFPFWLINHYSFLSDDTWAFDSTTNTLYIQVTDDPALHTWEYTTQNNGFVADAKSNVSIKNIEMSHYYLTGIWGENCPNITIDNCYIHDMRNTAIHLGKNLTTGRIDNCLIHDCDHTGIRLGSIDTFYVWDNEIYNISVGTDIGLSYTSTLLDWPEYPVLTDRYGDDYNTTKLQGNAINGEVDWKEPRTLQRNIDVKYNHCYNCGYGGIKLICTDSIIHYNHVHDFSLVFNDTGGVGTFGHNTTSYPQPFLCLRNTIDHNIVHDLVKDPYWDAIIDAGATPHMIYSDGNSSDGIITNNFVYNEGGGIRHIYLQYTNENMTIEDNIFGGGGLNMLEIYGRQAASVVTTKEVYFNRNTVFLYGDGRYLETGLSIPFENGAADYNTYINTIKPSNTAQWRIDTNDTAIALSFAQLQTLTGKEANSRFITGWSGVIGSPNTKDNFHINWNATKLPVTTSAPANFYDIDGNLVTEYTLQPYTGIILLYGYQG